MGAAPQRLIRLTGRWCPAARDLVNRAQIRNPALHLRRQAVVGIRSTGKSNTQCHAVFQALSAYRAARGGRAVRHIGVPDAAGIRVADVAAIFLDVRYKHDFGEAGALCAENLFHLAKTRANAISCGSFRC